MTAPPEDFRKTLDKQPLHPLSSPLNSRGAPMSQEEYFDVAVIGAGPGGYVAAIKAAQRGKNVALIEKDFVGGTCLNCGCIPTKTLIAHAQLLEQLHKASAYGITLGPIHFDYSKMKERKDAVILSLRKSLESLIKSHGVTLIKGSAHFTSPKTLKITGDSLKALKADTIIIATGSTTLDIPAFPCDHKNILNSTSILEISTLPKSLAIVGGGYIGCEFASLYAALGVKVTLLEALPSIISAQGKQLSDYLTKHFIKQGIDIKTNVIVKSITPYGMGVKITLADGTSLESEKVLIAAGRKVVSSGFGLENTGLTPNAHKTIDVDDKMETSVPGLYAIGDVTGKAMLAHVASHQGIVAATNATGGQARMHYHAVPAVIFTLPEIAMVGLSLDEATRQGLPAK
ncbi:MAG: NAD(P)/FAD-dependent oxidoreductase, partial [Chlamydiae bacterium]|nr:NAD(P)/FAD-dependent oxidoreductase [Chlamydiota bacterium]